MSFNRSAKSSPRRRPVRMSKASPSITPARFHHISRGELGMTGRSYGVVLSLGLILVAYAPPLQAQEAVKGLRYWLPVDIAILEVTVITTKTTEFVVTQSSDREGKLQKHTTTEVTREGQLSIRTQADHDVKT